jgi:DNA repair protein RadC
MTSTSSRGFVAADALLGIEAVDHVAVGDGRYISFLEIGRL